MGLVRYLQHWLGGAGPRLQVADFVPDPHPLRQWADTFPCGAGGGRGAKFCHPLPQTLPAGPPPYPDPGLVSVGVTQT